jgi:alpha-galactosidase
MSFRSLPAAAAGISVVFMVTLLTADDPPRFKVFILAGQSNMEGKAANRLLERQAVDPQTQELFAHLRANDQWIVRDDAFIKFLDRSGGLTIGYGSPDKTGVELEFGNLMADHLEEPVLLIKTAWGGHSLYQRFRPPGSGMPDDARLQAELEQAQQRVRNSNETQNRNEPLPTMENIRALYGESYRKMLREVHDTLDNYETLFPPLTGKKPELAGFVWFQGFNDMFGDDAPAEYRENMIHFIKDVRRDLKTPNLPFVIGALGQNGSGLASPQMQQIADAQLAMNDIPEFQGNVRAIRTDVLVDKEAERLFPDWEKHRDQWDRVGSDRPYHYLGSAIWFNRIGRAMGESMLELMPDTSAN